MNIKQSDITRATHALQAYYANKKLTQAQYTHLKNIQDMLRGIGSEVDAVLTSLELPCPGEAHSSPPGGMIDSCDVCSPDWGVIQNPEMVAK